MASKKRKGAKYFRLLYPAFTLLPFFFSLTSPLAGKASGGDFLLDQDCVYEYRYTVSTEVSIAREFYVSRFRLRAASIENPAYMTCRVPANEYNTLSLKFGMEYDSLARVRRVSIWLNGSEVEVVNISPDEVEELLVDISGVSNIHIEVACARTCGRPWKSEIHFIEADLQR